MTASAIFRFNWFTISSSVHDAIPDRGETELKAAYESLIARDGLLPNPDPPLNKTEALIRDTIVRLAREQQSPGLS
jgi:hypothetical protein